MSMVRAKFSCTEVAKQYGQTKVTLYPVYQDSEENRKFWAATPSGKLELNISNETAAQHFDVGKEFYVDFTPAE